jgi:hypothetical protein
MGPLDPRGTGRGGIGIDAVGAGAALAVGALVAVLAALAAGASAVVDGLALPAGAGLSSQAVSTRAAEASPARIEARMGPYMP